MLPPRAPSHRLPVSSPGEERGGLLSGVMLLGGSDLGLDVKALSRSAS